MGIPTTLRTCLGLLLFLSLRLAEQAVAQTSVTPGISLEAAYTGDIVANLHGGRREEAIYLDNINLTFTLDGEQLLGWRGGTLFFYGLGNQGGSPSRLAGAAQGVNNIEAPNSWRLYEALVQQILLDDHFSLLAGLYDINTEFDVLRTASLFINSSHGIGPDLSQSGKNGPSIFPYTSLGIRAKAFLGDALYLQFAALDGVPCRPGTPHGTHILLRREDGLLLNGEMALLLGKEEPEAAPVSSRTKHARHRRINRLQDAPYHLKIAIGGWAYTTTFEDVRGPGHPDAGSRGVYLLGELTPFHESDREQGLAVFARLGFADRRVNRFDRYFGAGFVYTGPFPDRDEDQVGAALAAAHNGAPYRAAQRNAADLVEDTETALEFSYRAQITERFALQGDLQYILNPDTNPTRSNAFLTGLRFELSL